MSESKQAAADTTIWRLTKSTAELSAVQLNARVDLQKPLQGLHKLTWDTAAVAGSVLGLAMSDKSSDVVVNDGFVRGGDLVASYGEADGRPFSLQVHWSVTPRENGAVVVDTLLSLETSLLENFPTVQVRSELPCDEVWTLPSQGTPVQLPSGQQHEGCDCLLLRGAGNGWSYAEMVHPEAPGQWQIDCQDKAQGVLQRTVGGAFLEKGVIRRLHLRGVFLPRENDLQLAAESLAELAVEAPPLD